MDCLCYVTNGPNGMVVDLEHKLTTWPSKPMAMLFGSQQRIIHMIVAFKESNLGFTSFRTLVTTMLPYGVDA